MTPFNGHSIQVADGEIILLKFIESMCDVDDDEDMVVDKLKGDVCLRIRTLSGKDYIVSMNKLLISINGGTLVGKDLARAVYEKWLWINKP